MSGISPLTDPDGLRSNQSDDIENLWMVCKVSGWSAKCPNNPRSIWMIWKVSRWSAKYPYNLSEWHERCLDHRGDLESVRNPDDPKSVQIIWKVYGWCAKCLDDPKCFPMIWKMSRLYVKCVLVWAYFAKHIFRQWWCHHHDHHDHHDHHHDYHQCKWVEEQSG